MWRRASLTAAILAPLLIVPAATGGGQTSGFDHEYATLADVLQRHVKPPRVDYAALQSDRSGLDRAVAAFASPAAQGESGWAREQRIAFWINAYNAFTLRVIVDHYPIRSGWLTLQPRDSIRQIDGVWTKIAWQAAGRTLTLDDIEHRILRPELDEPRVHFAINCASVSCPPLAAQPYRPRTLDDQLDAAARTYMASPEGLRVDGGTLRVSSIFKWFGDDFVEQYAPRVPGARTARERAVLGVIATYASRATAEQAKTGEPAIRFLEYNWSLNDVIK